MKLTIIGRKRSYLKKYSAEEGIDVFLSYDGMEVGIFEINSKVRKYQDILNNNYILEETLPGLFILIHALKSNFTRNEIEGNMQSYDLPS